MTLGVCKACRARDLWGCAFASAGQARPRVSKVILA